MQNRPSYQAIVDPEDFERLSVYRWNAKFDDGNVYAHACGQDNRGLYMHRLVMRAEPGQRIDHIDGNGLDNRKANLRPSTNAQNIRNQKPRTGGTSKYKGVYRRAGKFRAQIMCARRKINLGTFTDEVEAARVYDAEARKLFGEFARCNFAGDGRQ